MTFREHMLSHLGKRVIAILLVLMLSFSIVSVPVSAFTKYDPYSGEGVPQTVQNEFYTLLETYDFALCLYKPESSYSNTYDIYAWDSICEGFTIAQLYFFQSTGPDYWIGNTSAANQTFVMKAKSNYDANTDTWTRTTGQQATQFKTKDNAATQWEVVYTNQAIADSYGQAILFDINVPTPPVAGTSKSVAIPPGYAMSFLKNDVTTSNLFDFSFHQSFFNGIPPLVSTWKTGVKSLVSSGYPAVGDISFSNAIEYTWSITRSGSKATGGDCSFTAENISVGDAFTIYNPIQNPYLLYYADGSTFTRNDTMSVTFDSNAYSLKLFSIVTLDSFGFNPTGITDTETQPLENETGVIPLVNPEGVETIPPIGGAVGGIDGSIDGQEDGNGINQAITGAINSFKETLINLFAPGIEAIQTLTSNGSEFMEAVGGMFAWLPSDLSSVIVSGLILMVVIGVFKMLL